MVPLIDPALTPGQLDVQGSGVFGSEQIVAHGESVLYILTVGFRDRAEEAPASSIDFHLLYKALLKDHRQNIRRMIDMTC